MNKQLELDSPQDKTQVKGPVECLDMTFKNDEKRREHFLEKLREKLKDPAFRKIEGFPIGADEDILAMSDPPYYTACPNPFLEDFIKHYGRPYDPEVPYNRKPFAVDVSEGKTDPIYRAHSYHTKVPHLAIVPSILHYTEPGDIVLDGFCGSGMTGVAAQWCGTAPENFRRELEAVWERKGFGKPKWGLRRSVQCDLSPAATFIAANYNLPFDVDVFVQAGRQLLAEVEHELYWMYETLHTDGRTKGRIEYTVWSEVFSCPNCVNEVVFLDEALDEKTKRVQDTFPCPHCGANLTKNNLERIFETRIDPADSSVWKRVSFRPSLISYLANGQRYEKKPDTQDLQLIERILQLPLPQEIPINRFPIEKMYHGSRIEPKGFTHVHHFFLPRAAYALTTLWQKADSHSDTRIRHMLLFLVEQAIWGLSVLNRYGPLHFSQVNRYLTGVYYVASQHAECNPQYILAGKLDRLSNAFQNSLIAERSVTITTGTATHLGLPDNCMDYIFTDPPFGENIYYADLNFLVESWHRVLTNSGPEAVIDRPKDKTLTDYQRLMQQCFEEYYRVLKPGRWMTVVFHNSRNSVWNAIQEAMLAAGFVVADVRTMDKQQGSYRQVTSTAVKQDLVISAYKPDSELEDRFPLEAGTEEGVWNFIRTHLKQLPVFVTKDDRAEIIVERQNYLLFDRMVAYHVQKGVTVPLSAAEFYQELVQRFPERNGMYFLPDQAAEYDKKRMTVKEVLQLELFVVDETSAIQWLKQQLTKKPQTFQDLHSQFLREIGGWQKHEKLLELSDLLEENFLHYNGIGEVPSQIHSYLSTNFKELRNLSKDDPALRTKAKDRWYVPDPNKAGDLEKLRERTLLHEFWDYLPPGYKPAQPESQAGFIPGLEKAAPIPAGKKFRVIRMEAVRTGFKYCYQNRDYRTIIAVARRIPENILQEDQKLYMWYDLACTRSGEEA
jgi:16S rRNA G966 N2-methylase RsmD